MTKLFSVADYGQTVGDINKRHNRPPSPKLGIDLTFIFLGEKNVGEIFFEFFHITLFTRFFFKNVQQSDHTPESVTPLSGL